MAQEKQHGPMYAIIVISLTILIFGWAMWYAFRQDIMNAIKWLCVAELYAIDVFVNNPQVVEMREFLLSLKKGQFDMQENIAPALFLCGHYMKYVFAPFIAYWCYRAFMYPPQKMCRHSMNLDSMIKYQADSWPYITPFVNYDPGKESSRSLGDPVPVKLKTFAEALAPEEWLVYNDIDIDSESYAFNEEKAKKVFAKQLGKRWKGTSSLPEYQRALLAAFALKGARKREESDAFLGELSLCWSRKKGFAPTRKVKKKVSNILKSKSTGHEAIVVANNFAYVNSAMLATLAWARDRGGVLAPAQFVWLKGVDRDLWYALNSLGRRTYFSEGSGSIAHYYIEKGLGKPLVTINVDSAIESIKVYTEEHYPDIPVKQGV